MAKRNDLLSDMLGEAVARKELLRGTRMENPADPPVDTFDERYGDWWATPRGTMPSAVPGRDQALRDYYRGRHYMQPGEQVPDPSGFRGVPNEVWRMMRRI